MQSAPVILMADDDSDDRSLLRDAFREAHISADLHFVEDGDILLNFLFRKESYETPESSPRPDLILLDLNMPTDGRHALREIKSTPDLRRIPILIFTTSSSEEDILLCYELGANAYITKPATFKELVELVKVLSTYWFEMVKLPPRPSTETAGTCLPDQE